MKKVMGQVLTLVVPGMNNGFTVGDDIANPGTIVAMFEGVVLGVSTLAWSLQYSGGSPMTRRSGARSGLRRWTS